MPQNTIILIVENPPKGIPIVGNPHIQSKDLHETPVIPVRRPGHASPRVSAACLEAFSRAVEKLGFPEGLKLRCFDCKLVVPAGQQLKFAYQQLTDEQAPIPASCNARKAPSTCNDSCRQGNVQHWAMIPSHQCLL